MRVLLRIEMHVSNPFFLEQGEEIDQSDEKSIGPNTVKSLDQIEPLIEEKSVSTQCKLIQDMDGMFEDTKFWQCLLNNI